MLISLFVGLATLLPNGLEAEEYKFTNITSDNSNLSYNGVSVITQDSRGFIWLGTYKGLNRYDGNQFQVYTSKELGLPTDFIYTIKEDGLGNIWIGTDNGACCYLYEQDKFVVLDNVSDIGTTIHNKVTNIYFDHDGNVVLLVNNQGVFRYDLETGHLAEIPYSRFNVIGFRKILQRSTGDFLVTCFHLNLFETDEKFGNFHPIDLGGDSDYFYKDEIEGLFGVSSGDIYVTSTNKGISVIHPDDKTVKDVYKLPEGMELLDAFLEDESVFWLSTTNGLIRFCLEDRTSTILRTDKNDKFTISENYVNCCFVDKEGGIWVGTKDGGVCYSGNSRVFEKFNKTADFSLSGALIGRYASDGRDRLWIASERCGLLVQDLRTNKIVRVAEKQLPETICSICYDKDGESLFIGTLEGLFKMNLKNGTIRNFGVLKRDSGVNDPRVYLLFKSRKGDVFAGTTLGIFRYNRVADKFEDIHLFDGVFCTDIAEDADGHLWLSSYAHGLFRWDYINNHIPEHYATETDCGLKDNKIVSVLVDSHNRLWAVGFSHGFSSFDSSTGKFTVYDRSSLPELPSDVYFRMLEDREGRLWLSSDRGLVQFDLSSLEVKTYTTFEGLLDNRFMNGAIRLDDDTFYFSSANGFIRFNPQIISEDIEAPRLVINSISVRDVEKHFDRNPDLLRELVLTNAENSFSFDFSILQTSIPASGKVQCFLEGYDNQWRDILATKSLTYFNVPPGTYTLKFRSSIIKGQWFDAHAPVVVTLKPPFFASGLGIACIALAFILISSTIVFIENRKVRRKRTLLEERLRKEKDEELFQEKMNFFSHVIHEIKTPLTLIRTPLLDAMSRKGCDEQTSRDLEVMNNSTQYLTKLVNELLEYVRIERQGFTLNKENIDVVAKLDALMFDYKATATNANIRIEFHHSCQSAIVGADPAALDKIFNNLLINAIKFADSFIEICLDIEENDIVLSFENDGKKIPPAYRESIFKPFVQYRSDEKGNTGGVGIGLPLSRTLAQLHSGSLTINPDSDNTCFVLRLPKISVVAPMEEGCPSDRNLQNDKALILVADDNPGLRDYLASRLRVDYEVIAVATGEQALAVIKDRNVDLLLMDISMPGKNGLEICGELRGDIENSHIPIIILSARSSVESKIQAMEAGADLYIEKPFDLEYLRSSIKNMLDRRALLKKALSTGLASLNIDIFGLPKKDEEFFSTLNSLVCDHISETDLSVDFLATNLNMSVSTLTRKIKKLLNTTPINYVRSIRLSTAAQLLKDSHGNNITEIGYEVGFSNVSYFAKCFKEQYGKTPSEYAEGR